MKPQHFAVLAGFLVVVAIILMVAGKPGNPLPNGAAAQTPARVVTVTGEGEVKAKPDLLLVTFGVTEHRASAVDAEALVLASMKRVQQALIDAGADETQIELSPVTLTPETYQDFTGAVRIASYGAKGTVRAVVRHLTKAQAVMDAGLGAGATSLESALYSLDSPESTRQAAMKAALSNAQDRATAMVQAQGGRLGDLQSMEVTMEDAPNSASTPGGLVFRAKVKATFGY